MKLHLIYPHNQVIPDELEYLFDVVKQVADYFFHENINFYITNNPDLKLQTENNIIFLSGQEKTSILSSNNFKLCFNNFYRYNEDKRYVPFPLGNNKFINLNIFKHEPIDFWKREFDVFFAGFIHESRLIFKNAIEKLNCKKYIHYTSRNNIQNFSEDLNPDQYINILKNSKIVLAPRGAYHCTSYRYFESFYFQNILIYEKSHNEEIYLLDNFTNKFCINDWNNLNEDMIKSLIKDFDAEKQKKEYQDKISKHSIIDFVIKKIKSSL